MDIANLTRNELEVEILSDDSLLAYCTARGLMNGKTFTDEELRAMVVAWVVDGDECAGC